MVAQEYMIFLVAGARGAEGAARLARRGGHRGTYVAESWSLSNSAHLRWIGDLGGAVTPTFQHAMQEHPTKVGSNSVTASGGKLLPLGGFR